MKSQILFLAILFLGDLTYSLISASLFDEESAESRGIRGRSRKQEGEKKDEYPIEDIVPSMEDASTSASEYDSNETGGRIIGGIEATPNKHKFIASLQDNFGHFCGGSLIARDVVLSAAHCQGGRYNVVLGRHDLDGNKGQKIGMKRERPHPKYNDKTTDYDFMLVFLKRAATINRNVDLVKLNTASSIPKVNDQLAVMGWGDTDIRDNVSTLSDVLMQVQVKVMSNKECDDSSGTIDGFPDNYHGQITQNMLCAKANRQDSCQGDSGGPLVKGKTQIGVVSWGIGCASDDFPGVYARVSRAYDWIEREVCKGSQFAAEAGFDC